MGSATRQMTQVPKRAESTSRRTHGVEWWCGLVAVLVVSLGYMLYFVDRGWIPHDEGALAQSAERILAGELPHRDFVDGYTGGLGYINALAFRLFGVHLLALRYALFGACLAWVAVFFHVASRMVRPFAAGAVTVTAVFWSVPNYPAAMPSWYNLFLATAVLAALMQYIDSSKRRWLVGGGFAGGISVLMKTQGLLVIAAGLLFLLYHESQRRADAGDEQRSPPVLRAAIAGVLVAALVALLGIGLSRGTWLDAYQFALPGCAMVAIVGRQVFSGRAPSVTTAKLIVRAAVAYLLGAAAPIAAFVAYYAAAGALPELYRDLVLLPARLMDGASLIPSAPLGLIPMALVGFIAFDARGSASGLMSAGQRALATAAVVLLMIPRTALTLEPLVWSSLAEATPIVIPLLAFLSAQVNDREVRSRLVLIGCVAAFCSLVQYPYAAPIYFAYSLPLLLLAVVGVAQHTTVVRRSAVQGLAAVYLGFGALYIAPMKLPGLLGPIVREDIAILDLPRGGLRVGRDDAVNYSLAVDLIRQHASSGAIYAGPDAPEFYFLAELPNPTPVLFDYLAPDTLFHEHLLQRLDSLDVKAVALRRRVVHSPALEPHIQSGLVDKFPFEREVGRFTIRWRE